jgi:hypothetical protein
MVIHSRWVAQCKVEHQGLPSVAVAAVIDATVGTASLSLVPVAEAVPVMVNVSSDSAMAYPSICWALWFH